MTYLCPGFCPSYAPHHEADHAEAEEGEGVDGQVLEVLGEAPAAPEPRERPLHDPALGQRHEALGVAAADDLQPPAAGPGHRRRGRLAAVGAVGEDHLDEGEQPPRRAQQRDGAVPVLDVGRLDRGAQQQAQRVDQDLPLLALDLLARIVARRVDARPPFSALFTLWLSMIAAVGLASLPACSRAWTNKAWCRRPSVPSQAQSVR